jgi:hypothetical protein
MKKKKSSLIQEEPFEIKKYTKIFQQPENLLFCIEKVDYCHDRFAIYLRLGDNKKKLIKRSISIWDVPASAYYTAADPSLILNSKELSKKHLNDFLKKVLTQGDKLGLNKKKKLTKKFINAIFHRFQEKKYRSIRASSVFR